MTPLNKAIRQATTSHKDVILLGSHRELVNLVEEATLKTTIPKVYLGVDSSTRYVTSFAISVAIYQATDKVTYND